MQWPARIQSRAFCNHHSRVTGEDETPEGNPGKKWRCGWGFTPGTSAWRRSSYLTSSSRTSYTWTGSWRVIPTLDNPTNRSLFQLGTWPSELRSAIRSMTPKRTVCYQQWEWQQPHFVEKHSLYHAYAGAVEIEWQWLCFSPPMKKPYCQRCCVFGDPSVMQKEWANDVSGNPNNFEVKINSHKKTQAHLDEIIAFGRWKAG